MSLFLKQIATIVRVLVLADFLNFMHLLVNLYHQVLLVLDNIYLSHMYMMISLLLNATNFPTMHMQLIRNNMYKLTIYICISD